MFGMMRCRALHNHPAIICLAVSVFLRAESYFADRVVRILNCAKWSAIRRVWLNSGDGT